ncbi:MAG: hypothetical protein M3296_00100 [Actinomycetota bacterium]|nr:hypothetical protein [Actinomycetota bacterium]
MNAVPLSVPSVSVAGATPRSMTASSTTAIASDAGDDRRRAPKPYQPPDAPEGKINLTDLDSRNVKTPRGWQQGYNAQAVTTPDQIVIAADVTIDSPDFGHLEPMVTAARGELAYAAISDELNVVLADAGY